MDSKAKEGEVIEALATSVDKFGRPSKLTPQVIQQAWDYLNETSNIAVNAGGLLPTKERLALKLGVTRQTLENWCDQSSEFLDIYNTLEQMQADMLVQNGLVGRYTPAITAIMLSKHGYVKQEQVDNKVEMVQPILGAKAKEVIDVHSHDDDPQVVEATQED